MITKEDNPALFSFFDGPFLKDKPEDQKGEWIQKMCYVLTGIVVDIIQRKKPDLLDGKVHVAGIPVRWWHLLAVLYNLRYTREGDHTKFRNAILAIPNIQDAYRNVFVHPPKNDLSEIIRQGLTRPKNSQEYLNTFYNHCSSGVENEWLIKLPEKDQEIIKNLEEKLNEDTLEKVKMPVELSGNDAKTEQKTAGGNGTSGSESVDTGNGPKKSGVQTSDSGVDAGNAEPVKKSEVPEVHGATVSGGVQNGGVRADAGRIEELPAPAVLFDKSDYVALDVETNADCYVKCYDKFLCRNDNQEKFVARTGRENIIRIARIINKLGFISVEDESVMAGEVIDASDPSYSGSISVDLESLLNDKKDRIKRALNGHEDYVDFGLDVVWATCNVGASKAWEYGDYFAWGETRVKAKYSEPNYNKKLFEKYNSQSSNGKEINLEVSDDAARANWGGEWRMPTRREWVDLFSKTYSVWTEDYNKEAGLIVYKAHAGDEGIVDLSRAIYTLDYERGEFRAGGVARKNYSGRFLNCVTRDKPIKTRNTNEEYRKAG